VKTSENPCQNIKIRVKILEFSQVAPPPAVAEIILPPARPRQKQKNPQKSAPKNKNQLTPQH